MRRTSARKEADVQGRGPGYRYEIDIFWSDEDDCFVACVPDLENCAAWGTTYEETLARSHEAIRADLASRRVFGDLRPEPTPRALAEQMIRVHRTAGRKEENGA